MDNDLTLSLAANETSMNRICYLKDKQCLANLKSRLLLCLSHKAAYQTCVMQDIPTVILERSKVGKLFEADIASQDHTHRVVYEHGK